MDLRPAFVLVAATSLLACDSPAPSKTGAASASAAQAAASASTIEPPRNPPRPEPPEPLGEGDDAPAVKLTLHDGETVDLATMKDETVFVYFYPKDDTPGCTVEAKGLRDNYADLTQAGVKVYGVSMQDASSHKSFIDKHELPFPLVVDDGSVAEAFDVPVRGEYAARHSFLLKGGKVVKAWRKVDPAGHAAEVLEAAQTLSG